MGKITVETCKIEGLKIITPAVFGDERGYFMETYNYNDYAAAGLDMKTISPAPKKECCGDCIFRLIIPRTSWCAWSAERYLMWRWICAQVPKPTENGTALYCQRRIRSSFLFLKILPTAFWCFLIMRNLSINVRISIILMTRAA